MAAQTISIYPGAPDSGLAFSNFNAAAYAVLDGNALNTVNVTAAVYAPTGGRWWGRGVTAALDKPCVFNVVGSASARVLTDGRIYVPFTASPSITYYGSNIWRIELYTTAGGGTATAPSEVWFGALAGTTAASVVYGNSYAPAASLGQVGSAGLTVGGMATGAGIWFGTTEASVVSGTASVLYVWCPNGASQNPAVQWSGIAAVSTMTGSVGAGSPAYGPFVVSRSGSNDPSGTIVNAGFACLGSTQWSTGSVARNAAVASVPVSTVLYDSIQILGGEDAFYIGSDQLGTTLTSFRLQGDWSFDGMRDPQYYPIFTSIGGRGVINMDTRAKSIEVRGGTVTISDTHGSISINPVSEATPEERPSNCSVIGTRFRARGGSAYSRSAGVHGCDNATVSQCQWSGFTVRAQIGGYGTLLHSNEWLRSSQSTADPPESAEIVQIRADLDATPASTTVRFYRNLVDQRGNAGAYACVGLRATNSGNISANMLDARDNVALGDSGMAAYRTSYQGSGTISATQRITGTMHNLATEAYNSVAPGTAQGSATTLAALFSTGTTTGTTYVAGNGNAVLSRGDRPTNRWGERSMPR